MKRGWECAVGGTGESVRQVHYLTSQSFPLKISSTAVVYPILLAY